MINEARPASDTAIGIDWTKLLAGLVITGTVALSVHVVMLQVLGVAFPEDGATPPWGAWLNNAGTAAGLIFLHALAGPRFARRSFIVRTLVIFALLAMLKEVVRGAVMGGVVTTGWTFSALAVTPSLLLCLGIAVMVAALAPRLPSWWTKLLGGGAISLIATFALRPLIGMAWSPIMQSAQHLAREDVYQLPYPVEVMIPAYLTFAEPVAACVLIAALVWSRLSPGLLLRFVQFAALILFIKGVVFRLLVYSFFIKAPLGSAMLSESQFTLEFLALAVLTGLVWQWSTRPAVRLA